MRMQDVNLFMTPHTADETIYSIDIRCARTPKIKKDKKKSRKIMKNKKKSGKLGKIRTTQGKTKEINKNQEKTRKN